jgi:site-specific DNA recombinase
MQASKDEGSLDTQEARLRAAIMARSGDYEVRYVFREEGESGKSLDRPALQGMLEHVRRGDIDLVMVTRLDRLSRSLLDFYEVHRLFEKHGVQFVSLNETFDTSSAVGRAMLKLVLVFAELEREQTAERTRLAIQARAERGLWNGGHPPLGYDSAGNGHLKVNPVEAELVRGIFARYLEERSAIKVAKWLNDAGHRQKTYISRRKGERGGNPFTVATVRYLLQNRLYLGEIDHKGQIFEGQHEPIIDRDIFERIQSIMETHTQHPGGPLERAQYDYLLTGLLRCTCGNALTTSSGNGKGGRYHYYRCVGLQKRTDHVCPVKQLRAEVVDDAVLSIVRDAAHDPKLLEVAVEEVNRLAREQVTPLQERVNALKQELADAERMASELLKQILSSGVSGSPTAKKLLADAEARQEQLRATLAEAEGELATQEAEQLDREVMLEALRSFDTAFAELTLPEKRELLQLMLKEVEIHPDHLVVELYEGRRAIKLLEGVKRGERRTGNLGSDGNGSPNGSEPGGFSGS